MKEILGKQTLPNLQDFDRCLISPAAAWTLTAAEN